MAKPTWNVTEQVLNPKLFRKRTKLQKLTYERESLKELYAQTKRQLEMSLSVNKQVVERLAQMGLKLTVDKDGSVKFEAVKK